MTVRDRILSSKPFMDGKEFTIARMTSQLKTAHKTSVSCTLSVMVSNGDLNIRVDEGINFYSKPGDGLKILHRAWVSRPTNSVDTPVWK